MTAAERRLSGTDVMSSFRGGGGGTGEAGTMPVVLRWKKEEIG